MAKTSNKKLVAEAMDHTDDSSFLDMRDDSTMSGMAHNIPEQNPEHRGHTSLRHGSNNDHHSQEQHSQDHHSKHESSEHHESNGLSQLFSNTFLHADQLFFADIKPLNNSGVSGEAVLALNENANGTATLTLEIAATGLDPNQVHPIHIHGFPTGTPDSHVPTLASDVDHDGFIEVAEGAHDYGPILLSLTHNGAFPTAPDGTFLFTQSYSLPSAPHLNPTLPVLSELGLTPNIPLDLREIVIHGLTLPHNGSGLGAPGGPAPDEADGTPGYKTVLPVAAGEIQDSHGNSALAHFANYIEGHFHV